MIDRTSLRAPVIRSVMDCDDLLLPEKEGDRQQEKTDRRDVAKAIAGRQQGLVESRVIPAQARDQAGVARELHGGVEGHEHEPEGAAAADAAVELLGGVSERNARAPCRRRRTRQKAPTRRAKLRQVESQAVRAVEREQRR